MADWARRVYEVEDEAAMLAIPLVQRGDIAIREDLDDASFVHNGGSAGTLADWNALGSPETDTEALAAIAAHVARTDNPHTVTKAQVGLGNVNNTADTNKPVSTAQQAALDLKASLDSPALTGNPTVPTQGAGNSTTRAASTAYVQGEVAALVTLAPATTARNVIQPSADVVPLTLKGKAGQTADLLQLQNSAGAALARFTAGGALVASALNVTNGDIVCQYATQSIGGGIFGSGAGYIGRLTATPNYAGDIAFAVRGVLGQTADLVVVQDSTAAVVAAVTPTGKHRFAAANEQITVGAAGAAVALPATPTKFLKVVDSAGATLVVPAYAAA